LARYFLLPGLFTNFPFQLALGEFGSCPPFLVYKIKRLFPPALFGPAKAFFPPTPFYESFPSLGPLGCLTSLFLHLRFKNCAPHFPLEKPPFFGWTYWRRALVSTGDDPRVSFSLRFPYYQLVFADAPGSFFFFFPPAHARFLLPFRSFPDLLAVSSVTYYTGVPEVFLQAPLNFFFLLFSFFYRVEAHRLYFLMYCCLLLKRSRARVASFSFPARSCTGILSQFCFPHVPRVWCPPRASPFLSSPSKI